MNVLNRSPEETTREYLTRLKELNTTGWSKERQREHAYSLGLATTLDEIESRYIGHGSEAN